MNVVNICDVHWSLPLTYGTLEALLAHFINTIKENMVLVMAVTKEVDEVPIAVDIVRFHTWMHHFMYIKGEGNNPWNQFNALNIDHSKFKHRSRISKYKKFWSPLRNYVRCMSLLLCSNLVDFGTFWKPDNLQTFRVNLWWVLRQEFFGTTVLNSRTQTSSQD